MTTAERGSPGSQRTARFFAEPVRDYVAQCVDRPVSVLQAGCQAPLRDLGIDELADGGFEISVTAVDADQPLARRVLRDTRASYDDVITGDLRTVPIPQRAYDVVYCALLLERVQHVELVLDRLTSALKPGGLLLLRTGDRYSANALLDRMLPRMLRRAVWSRFRPGTPGPFAPVYEKAVSQEGIASYALMRGLVISARGTELTRPERPPGLLAATVRVTCAVISLLSGGRFADSHDELLYVIRKPLDRFARVVLSAPADPARRPARPRSRPPAVPATVPVPLRPRSRPPAFPPQPRPAPPALPAEPSQPRAQPRPGRVAALDAFPTRTRHRPRTRSRRGHDPPGIVRGDVGRARPTINGAPVTSRAKRDEGGGPSGADDCR